MTPPKCPNLPQPSEEHKIDTQAIEADAQFVLESPDRKLLSGPQSRLRELKTVLRMGAELAHAFRILHFVGPCITIFGSARTSEGDEYYELARRMGAECAQLGFTVITGGGPGIMEAGNRGAYEAGGRSIGVNIKLPFEQEGNPYVDKSIDMHYFFTRKVVLTKYSYGFIVMPGGVGTLDEMFEMITLIQTKKICDFPIVLMGKSFWQPLMDFMHKMAEAGTISKEDPDLIFFTDDPAEATAHLKKFAVRKFGLRRKYLPTPKAILGEKSLVQKSPR